MNNTFLSHHDLMQKLYQPNYYNEGIKNGEQFYANRSITFQITEDCCFQCSYCYQKNKSKKIMSKETAKKAVDLLFDMYEKNNNDFINKNTKSLTLEFIGGEPLINIEIIDYICTYFLDKCLETNHIWLYTWRISITSNGVLYLKPEVKEFFKKFKNFISFTVTVDGPKEIHDACRLYPNGDGTFNDTYQAIQEFNKEIYPMVDSKVTIAPENLHNLNKIIDYFIAENYQTVHANPVFEAKWTSEQGKIYYDELKIMADKILNNNINDIYISLFESHIGKSLPESENQNWCGGTMNMLAFDPDGLAYPCLRYMPSSLNGEQKPLVVGDLEGLFRTEKQKETADYLSAITRRSQSTDECFYCPIASGCAWCSAWNYQETGDVNKRSTNICWMHRARVLANVYYWNKYYKQNNIDKKFDLNLPEDIALQIISKEEYQMLKELVNG